MTSSERLVAKSLKLPVHPIVSRRSRRARASLLAAPTTTRLIQPSLETPSANTPRARARASRPTAPPIDPRASNHAAFASSRASSSRASAPARPPRSRRHAPRCVHARYPPTDSFAPASAQIARTVSVAGSMRRSARARRRVAPRARRRRRRRRDVPSYGQTVRRSRRVPTAVDARARRSTHTRVCESRARDRPIGSIARISRRDARSIDMGSNVARICEETDRASDLCRDELAKRAPDVARQVATRDVGSDRARARRSPDDGLPTTRETAIERDRTRSNEGCARRRRRRRRRGRCGRVWINLARGGRPRRGRERRGEARRARGRRRKGSNRR